jgi:hypothetical protein
VNGMDNANNNFELTGIEKRIYEKLVEVAKNKTTITYGDLAESVGFTQPLNHIGSLLGVVSWHSLQNDGVLLSVLVVSKDTGLPSDGFINEFNHPETAEKTGIMFTNNDQFIYEHQKLCYEHVWSIESQPASEREDKSPMKRIANKLAGSKKRKVVVIVMICIILVGTIVGINLHRNSRFHIGRYACTPPGGTDFYDFINDIDVKWENTEDDKNHTAKYAGIYRLSEDRKSGIIEFNGHVLHFIVEDYNTILLVPTDGDDRICTRR